MVSAFNSPTVSFQPCCIRNHRAFVASDFEKRSPGERDFPFAGSRTLHLTSVF